MKRLLLDTHALIWWLNGDKQLGKNAREVIGNSTNPVYISAATTWEMSIKHQLGKLDFPDDIDKKIEEAGFIALPISLFHGKQAGDLPLHHSDPFDRMLIAQAQAEGLTIVTKDKSFPEYGIKTIDATN
jgi:PIN domain nuclease of toxin-antitoxin system